MLVACFVLIGNSYFNVDNIKYISSNFKSAAIVTGKQIGRAHV